MTARVIDSPRAPRSDVMWPARVRRFNQTAWHHGVVTNISFTGALLKLPCRCEVGEWLAVEIEFRDSMRPDGVLARCGPVVRKPRKQSKVVAVQFLLSGTPKERRQSAR